MVLGTDGAASNNDLDLWAELQTATLLAKAVQQDAAALPAIEAIKMVTAIAGAVYAPDAFTGQLRPGYAADLCSVQLDGLDCWPVHQPVAQLVYGRTGDKVQNVWVAGQGRVIDGKLVGIDLSALREDVQGWREAIQAHSL